MDIWVYFVLFGITLSAFMASRSIVIEEKENKKYIEAEGNVYIERMKEEREQRQQKN